MARHAQITQNNKLAISLQYLKKEVSNEIDGWEGGLEVYQKMLTKLAS